MPIGQYLKDKARSQYDALMELRKHLPSQRMQAIKRMGNNQRYARHTYTGGKK